MNAPTLLATLRERGAHLSVRVKDGGAPVLFVAPRGIAADLAGEVARFKPTLLELLEREAIEHTPTETAPDFLKRLQAAGVSVRVGDVNGARALMWEFPRGLSRKWERIAVKRLERDAEEIAVLLDAAARPAPQPRRSWRERDAAYWEWVANSISPGAASICAVLQDFTSLFDLAGRGALPPGDCRALIDGEPLVFEEVPALLIDMQIQWGALAESFNRSGGDLSQSQREALDRARQLLVWLHAAQGIDEWLDLEQLVNSGLSKAKREAKQKAQSRQEAA